jgi:hypothetical protein
MVSHGRWKVPHLALVSLSGHATLRAANPAVVVWMASNTSLERSHNSAFQTTLRRVGLRIGSDTWRLEWKADRLWLRPGFRQVRDGSAEFSRKCAWTIKNGAMEKSLEAPIGG